MRSKFFHSKSNIVRIAQTQITSHRVQGFCSNFEAQIMKAYQRGFNKFEFRKHFLCCLLKVMKFYLRMGQWKLPKMILPTLQLKIFVIEVVCANPVKMYRRLEFHYLLHYTSLIYYFIISIPLVGICVFRYRQQILCIPITFLTISFKSIELLLKTKFRTNLNKVFLELFFF